MDLAGTLGLGERELVAFVGAGGKKTAMGELVRAGGERNLAVGYTTTTHTPPPPDLPLVVAPAAEIQGAIEGRTPPVAFAAEAVDSPDRVETKVRGYDPSLVDELFEQDVFDWLLVKADGARQREFKAPAEHEPAIPARSTVVVVVASVQAVGEPLDESVVHRPERVAAISGLELGAAITPTAMGNTLASGDGGCKGIPAESEAILLVNKADTPDDRETAREIIRAAFARSDRFSRGLITSFREDISQSVVAEN